MAKKHLKTESEKTLLRDKFKNDIDKYSERFREQYRFLLLTEVGSRSLNFSNFMLDIMRRLQNDKDEILNSYMKLEMPSNEYQDKISALNYLEQIMCEIHAREKGLN